MMSPLCVIVECLAINKKTTGGFMSRLSKQRLRAKLSTSASYAEIYLTGIILIGVLFFSVDILRELYLIVITFPHYEMTIETFLAHVLALIIAIEFVKMLAKHTPGSAIDVLLFAIARKLIISESTMLNSLIGVVAIAILFAVRKYLSSTVVHNGLNASLVNGGLTIKEFNDTFRTKVDENRAFTIAGLIANYAKERKHKIQCGYILEVEGRQVEVYSMDDHLIKQVKVFDPK